MDKNQEADIGTTQKLAFICDGLQQMYPNGRVAIVVELNKDEFGASKGIFGVDDLITKKFKIDISGTEIIFLSDELLIDEGDNS